MTCHWFSGNATLVVVSTEKLTPDRFVNANWKLPFPSTTGDVRGRFDGVHFDNPAGTDRNRFRYRMRFGVVAAMNDNFEAGMRQIGRAHV